MFFGLGYGKGQKIPSALRFGVTLFALVTLYILFTVYRQLGEARQIFSEIALRGLMVDGRETTQHPNSEDGREHRHKYIVHNSRNNNAIDLTLLKSSNSVSTANDNISMGHKYTQQFRSHFQQNVYTIERRIFESNQKLTTPPSNFVESNGYSEKRRNVHSKVMILAYGRSGSSFLGEMFNRNPKAFYLFEPLKPIEVVAGRGKFPLLYDTLVGHLLHVVYTCSFSKDPFLVAFLSSSPFRLKSQILQSNGLCAAGVTPRKMHLCRSVNATILTRLCRSSSHIVVKTIRANSRKSLAFLSSGSEPGHATSLNVIHLVRDPRAIISSRLTRNLKKLSRFRAKNNDARKVEKVTRALMRSVRVASSNLCSRIYSDMKYAGQESFKPYAMVRYEDAAMQPIVAYKQISKFTGIDESIEVRKWLRKNTRSDMDLDYYYSTSRNSTASIHGWRSRLPMKLVLEIQKQCSQLMNMLGYVSVDSEMQLKDMSTPLVMPLTEGSLLQKNPMSKVRH